FVTLPGFPEASSRFIAGSVFQPRYVYKQRPRLRKSAMGIEVLVAGRILHQPEQRPAEDISLVAADIIECPLALGLALLGCLTAGFRILPALGQSVSHCKLLQVAFLPLPTAYCPLTRMFAQQRAAVQGKILSQRLVQMLGQHIEVIRIEVLPERGEEDVEP